MLLWASSGAVFELSITEFATFRDGQHKAASVTVVLNSGPVFSARFSVSGPVSSWVMPNFLQSQETCNAQIAEVPSVLWWA